VVFPRLRSDFEEKKLANDTTPPDPENGQPGVENSLMLIDIEHELRRSYLGYAVSTLISRALPDVRDGFKPVQRRILYAMRDLGVGPGSARVKSAKVVGECFVSGTLVTTPAGLIPIERLNVGDTVYTQSGIRRVTEAYVMPEQPLLQVDMTNGATVTCTPGQQFKVLTDDLSIVWKNADELLPGEYVLSRSAQAQTAGYIETGGLTVDEDLAYLLGFFLADGWVDRDRKRGYDRLSFACNDLAILQKLQSIICRKFNIAPAIQERRDMYYLRINASDLNRQMIDAFQLQNKYAHTISVPDAILRSGAAVVCAFVSGFADGDGSVHKDKNVLVLTSVSAKFIRDLQTLLHSLQIHSQLFKYDKTVGQVAGKIVTQRYDTYVLEISSLSFQKLGEQLTLTHSVKSARLNTCLHKKEFQAERAQLIPYLGAKVIEEFRTLHLGGGWYVGIGGQKVRSGLRYEDGTKLRYHKQIAETFEVYFSTLIKLGIIQKMEAIGSAYTHLVNQLIADGITFSQVKAVRDAEAQVTYDIQVAEDHEFVANGLLVHNCMGNYHPHGDQALYGTLVRMAQDFSMRYPLVDPQGNFGSVDGDPPAAQRYTECRLTPLAMEMMEDIERETVDFRPNYDQSRREPIVLPGKFPNFLCNGGEGIAVGMSTSVPPHNLREVVDASIYMLDHSDATPDDLFKFITGPDFPTAALILGTKGAKDAYRTGRGRVVMQAQLQIEPMDNGKNAIVVTELPYQVNKSRLIEHIADLVRQKKVEGITALNDFSDKHGMRIVIELRRDVMPRRIVNFLLKHTALRQTFGIIMLALVNDQPKMLNLPQVINLHLAHRKEVIVRRTRYELGRAKQQAHILEGLQIALNFLDEIIALIRRSPSSEVARTDMCAQFGLTQIQAEAILNMQLRQISQLERQKTEDDYKNRLREIARLEDILVTPARVVRMIKDELRALRDKYGDERRTRILPTEADEITEEDLIPEEKTLVTITRDGYIKRVPVDTYRTQKRGGKGVQAANLKEEDQLAHLFMATTTHYILFFTNRGRVYRLKAYEVPQTSRQARGQHINNFIQTEPGDQVTAILPIKDMTGTGYLLMTTEYGEVKRTALSEFANLRANGLNCFDIEEGDNLKWVRHTDGQQEVILVTRNGMSIRFPEGDVPERGRQAGGVRGIDIRDPKTKKVADRVVGMDVVSPTSQLLAASENGFGKRTDMAKYRAQGRGGRGITTMDITAKTGPLVDAVVVEPDDKLMVLTDKGITIRMDIGSIRAAGRSTQGVQLIKLGEGDRVCTIERLVDTEAVEEEANATAQNNGTNGTNGTK
jgi:DNA gyrase subunit A